MSIDVCAPEELLDAIGVAADRARELAAQGRELHFDADAVTGRVVIQVRDLASGKVICAIPPSAALTVLSGGAPADPSPRAAPEPV